MPDREITISAQCEREEPSIRSIVKIDDKEQYNVDPNGVCIVCVEKKKIANGLIRVIL